jgi:hypothetical protein
MFYINKQGVVIEALQWDESEKTVRKIDQKFFPDRKWGNGAKIDSCAPTWLSIKWDYEEISYPPKSYIYIDPIDGEKVTGYIEEIFEQRFKPITNKRFLLAESFKKLMLRELQANQHKGDNWLEMTWLELRDLLKEEFNELGAELWKVEGNAKDADLEALETEAAHLAICAAFIADKARNLRALDELWKKEEADGKRL